VKRIVPLAIVAAVTALAVAVAALGATILNNPPSKLQLAYAKKSLTATRGVVTLRSKNMSAVLKHDIALRKGVTAKGKTIAKGKTVGTGGVSVARATLARGKYRFFCTVPGHEQGGMWGILTVK
jgi:uncharacterized cupredoxin-like copper-binding protein